MVDYNKKVSIFINSMGGGGAERVVSLLLKPLSLEYTVTLIVMFPIFAYDIPRDIQVISLLNKKPQGLIQNIFVFPLLIYRYLKTISKIKPDIAISFLFKPNIINGILKRFKKNIKVILSERNYPSIMYSSSRIRFIISRFFIKRYYSKADIIFSNSYWINNDLKENFGVLNPKYEVVYNPIELAITTKKNIESVGNKITSVGRIIDIKNHQLIIDALSLLLDKADISLTIFGEGCLRDTLTKYSINKQVKNVFFPGFSLDIKRDLLKYDIFVLSSNSEGFPNALLEAMSVGLPVISTNCKSGPLELLNNNEEVNIDDGNFVIAKYGILVKVGDFIALAKAIEKLSDDIALRKKLSRLSLERAKDYSLEKVYRKLVIDILEC